MYLAVFNGIDNMFDSTEYVSQAIILIIFLDNIVTSLTFPYLINLWTFDLTAVFLFCIFSFYYFNQVLTYFNKFNLFMMIFVNIY